LLVIARGLMVRAASVDYYAAHKQSDASSPTPIGDPGERERMHWLPTSDIRRNISDTIGFN